MAIQHKWEIQWKNDVDKGTVEPLVEVNSRKKRLAEEALEKKPEEELEKKKLKEETFS